MPFHSFFFYYLQLSQFTVTDSQDCVLRSCVFSVHVNWQNSMNSDYPQQIDVSAGLRIQYRLKTRKTPTPKKKECLMYERSFVSEGEALVFEIWEV